MAGPNLQISGVVEESLLNASASPPLAISLAVKETLMQALSHPILTISGVVIETLLTGGSFNASLADSAVSSDSFISNSAISISFSSTVASSDSIAETMYVSVVLLDSIAASDSFSGIVSISITLADTAATSTSFTELTTAIAALIDTITTSDTFTSNFNVEFTLTDIAITVDSFSAIAGVSASLTDTINSADIFSAVKILASGWVDSVVTSDAFISLFALVGALHDTVVASDLFTIGFLANWSDTVASSDTFIVSNDAFYASWEDTVNSSDLFYYETLDVIFDALVQEVLESGVVSTVAFDGLSREVLASALSSSSVDIRFASVVRETLVLLPQGFGAIPVFPTLPESFPVKVDIVLDTIIGTTKSLREMRVAQQTFPLWDIELPFPEIRDQTQNQVPYEPFVYPQVYQEYETLVENWLMMYGQANVFAFDCPWDDSRSNQLIGTGDGVSYIFQIYRTWGLGAQATIAPVGMVNTIFEVQVNGVTVPSSHYFVNRDKICFVDAKGFIYPPGAGLDITLTFSYYYLCRFTEDEQDFEEFAKNRWTVPSLKFRAVVWP